MCVKQRTVVQKKGVGKELYYIDRSMVIQGRKENSKQRQKGRPETACGHHPSNGTHNFRMPSNKVLKDSNSAQDKASKKAHKK